MFDYRPMQTRLGVKPDNAPGRATLAALFAAMGAGKVRAADLALGANVHFRTYGILDTPLRLAHFIGQTAHESSGFVDMEERGGAGYFAKYDGRADLGNVKPGDGALYHGRGPLQITGRANYREYGEALGIDFEGFPAIVAQPAIGIMVACKYWADRGLNEAADRDDLDRITRRINGGVNGLADRKDRTAKAKGIILP